MTFAGLAVLILGIGGLTPLAAAEPTEIDLAFRRMYNFDFPGAHRYIDQRISHQPGDHFAYVTRACAYLFVEMDRMGILESSFLTDDERIAEKRKKERPDPAVKQKFMEAVTAAQTLAGVRLAKSAEDSEALFTMAISNGLVLDYNALIEKRQIASLGYAKQSQSFAARALRQNPRYYDAYLTSGVSEYLLGSVPFFVRWFLRFDDVQGSKEQAVVNLKKVATGGRYMGPFARILLAVISLREKKPAESAQYLRDLAREFPENPLIRKELALVEGKLGLPHGTSSALR